MTAPTLVRRLLDHPPEPWALTHYGPRILLGLTVLAIARRCFNMPYNSVVGWRPPTG